MARGQTYQIRDLVKCSAPVSPFWEDKVVDVHLWKRELLFDHRIWISCVKLTDTWFNDELPRHEYSWHLNALFQGIFGDLEYIPNPNGVLEPLITPSVLYIQSSVSPEGENPSAALSRVGLTSTWDTAAARIEGTWFFPGLFGIGDHEWKALAALDNLSSSSQTYILALPAVVCDLVYLQALANIATKLVSGTNEMPFLGTTAEEYVRRFLASDKFGRVLRPYQSSFLKDKERNVEIRLRLDREAQQLDEEAGHNLFLLWKERAYDGVTVTDSLRWPGKITLHMDYAYQSPRKILQRRLETSRTHEEAIAELLRDRAVAASAQTNIRLQVLLFILTCLTLVPVVEQHWSQISALVRQLRFAVERLWPL